MKVVFFEIEPREFPVFESMAEEHVVSHVEQPLDRETAGGELIDTRALIQALTSGKVAAAGLDVLPDEPLIREEAELICSIYCEQHDLRDLVANHVLLRMKNVVVTPHSAKRQNRDTAHRLDWIGVRCHFRPCRSPHLMRHGDTFLPTTPIFLLTPVRRTINFQMARLAREPAKGRESADI